MSAHILSPDRNAFDEAIRAILREPPILSDEDHRQNAIKRVAATNDAKLDLEIEWFQRHLKTSRDRIAEIYLGVYLDNQAARRNG